MKQITVVMRILLSDEDLERFDREVRQSLGVGMEVSTSDLVGMYTKNSIGDDSVFVDVQIEEA